MSILRHIYRNNKLVHIPSKRYSRKYNPEYLKEKASKGVSTKLGIGDFDGDGDIDGTYPKQRASVAEKPGLLVRPDLPPLRGPRFYDRVPIVSPNEGPASLNVLRLPSTGPLSLNTTIVKPALGPVITRTVVSPDTGPNTLASSIVAPAAGPNNLVTGAGKPLLGPVITRTVISPGTGPSSLSATYIAAPLSGPTNLSIPVPKGFDGRWLNLRASLATPVAGPRNFSASVREYQNAILFKGFDEFNGVTRRGVGSNIRGSIVTDFIFYGIEEYPGVASDSSYFTLVGWNGRYTGLLGVRRDDRTNDPDYTGYEISSINASEGNAHYNDHDFATQSSQPKFSKATHGGFAWRGMPKFAHCLADVYDVELPVVALKFRLWIDAEIAYDVQPVKRLDLFRINSLVWN